MELIREMQRIAGLMYDTLSTLSSLNLATPGAGDYRDLVFSDFKGGFAVKPQIGETPAQVLIVGFYQAPSSDASLEPWPEGTVLNVNTTITGLPGQTTGERTGHGWDALPVTQVQSEVKTLKSLIVNSFNDPKIGLPGQITWSVFRLDYNGVMYGDRGFHFPQ